MTTKRYRVKLTAEEREELKALTTKGRVSARKQTHARILLQCDECREDGGRTDGEIAEALDVGVSTVVRARRRCVEEGLEAALNRKEQLNRRTKVLDGEAEARLVHFPEVGCAVCVRHGGHSGHIPSSLPGPMRCWCAWTRPIGSR